MPPTASSATSSPNPPELLRPRFHFTSRINWLNDPNGLVYVAGEWHLFYQYNAVGIVWGPNSWGHAVSTDLVHWRQLPDALDPDEEFGWMWSGSAVIDHDNTSGLGDGRTPPLVAIYTTGLVPGWTIGPRVAKPVVQGIASSRDGGLTWQKFAANPVIKNIEHENRDPKVIWYAPTKRWIMALYIHRNDFSLFSSPDLKQWTLLQTLKVDRASECPDFFPLAVDGDPARMLWVLWAGDGLYRLGTFDGATFIPTTGSLIAEFGPNGYAAQSWSDAPDNRRVQISWMRGGRYPYMPFNQQMSFPVELLLRNGPDGIQLCRMPVREIEKLWGPSQRWADHQLAVGATLKPDAGEGLYDIALDLEPTPGAVFMCRIHGHALTYHCAKGTLSLLGRDIAVPLRDRRLKLRILVDRTSIEVFAHNGGVSASFCFLPDAWDSPLVLLAEDSPCRIASLDVRHVRSALAGLPASSGAA